LFIKQAGFQAVYKSFYKANYPIPGVVPLPSVFDLPDLYKLRGYHLSQKITTVLFNVLD